jgi:hypothetical protein
MQEWNAEAKPNIPIGALYATLGILFEVSMLGFITLFMLDQFRSFISLS